MGVRIIRRIEEKQVPGHRLGRHIEHDPRSLDYQVTAPPQLKNARHQRHCAPFNQGDIGSCTGNAMAAR